MSSFSINGMLSGPARQAVLDLLNLKNTQKSEETVLEAISLFPSGSEISCLQLAAAHVDAAAGSSCKIHPFLLYFDTFSSFLVLYMEARVVYDKDSSTSEKDMRDLN